MAVILELPALVLPKAPDDSDKLMYIRSGRWLATSIGMLSFLSLSAGMVLFIKASVVFYWFGAFFVFFAAYMTMSYVAVGLRGRDFDYVKHQAIVAEGASFRPDVDVYLPICGEDLILINNTWTHVAAVDWPRERLHVYVLDDGNHPDAHAMALSYGFDYIVRGDRPHLKKAGNLRYAFARTQSPFITILDADFCPRPDFLHDVIPYFAEDAKLAILQTPQFFKVRREQKWVERGAGIVQELFYRAVQVNRDNFGAAICVGTCGTYRRTALEPFGGTAAIDYSEDVHTGFHVLDAGWRVKYIPVCLASGVCPDNLPAFFIQQYRWAMGSTTLFLNPEFWKSKLTMMQKVAYLSGMMYYWATALGIFMNPVPAALLVWVKPSAVLWYNIAFAVPSILMSHVVMRVWCKQPYGWSALSVKAVQNYAHLYAIRDKLMGRMVPWVPTGSASSKKCARFDSARRLCWAWSILSTGVVVSGCGLRIWQEYLPWYAVAPTIAATLLNFATQLGMMLASSPKKAPESDLQAPLPVE